MDNNKKWCQLGRGRELIKVWVMLGTHNFLYQNSLCLFVKEAFGLCFWTAFLHLRFLFLFVFSFFNWERCFHVGCCLSVGPMHRARDPLPLWPINFALKCVCQWVPYIVHRTHKPLFSHKLSLKIDPTILFTHLKIILLKYFQFSIFNFSKISFIQMYL